MQVRPEAAHITTVIIGHINLEKSLRGIGEHFVCLVEALQQQAMQQHSLVRNIALAKRLDKIADVSVGPVVTTAITAACCMPHVSVVHVHQPAAAQAGLLLTLTRSMPYVLTHRGPIPGKNPVVQSAYRRAAAIICVDETDASALVSYDPSLRIDIVPDANQPALETEAHAGCRVAAMHVPIYRRATEKWRIPAMLL